jgi:hypothetical protein
MGLRTAARGSDTTQIQARRWCERNVMPDEIMVQEGYSAPLPTAPQVERVRGSNAYRLASPRWRSRLDSLRTFRVVALPLGVSGPVTTVVRLNGTTRTLEVLPHAEQLNRVFYDARLFAGVDYFMTSSSVRGRYLADSARFPVQAGFYALLGAAGEELARFRPAGSIDGPEIVVYRLGPRYREAIAARGEPDSLWWADCVPREYREAISGIAVESASGLPAWIGTLGTLYDQRVRPFAELMTLELAATGRWAAARGFALATHTVHPDDETAATLLSVASRLTGRPAAARAAIERLQAARPEAGRSPVVRFEYARALQQSGEHARAREMLRELSAAPPGDPIGEEARRLLARRS